MNTKKKKQSLEIPKGLILIGKFLQTLSKNWAASYAQKLFITPIKFTPPQREREMIERSINQKIYVNAIQKDIVVYSYGMNKKANKKALLVHGWNGRGTQLVTVANMLTKQNYDVVSFDAPGHGRAPKTKTNMEEFIESILEIEKQFGPFDLIVGHSLGGMATINALHQGFKADKAIIIGSGDIILDVFVDFVKKLDLKPIIVDKLKERFEKQLDKNLHDYSVHSLIQALDIPILIIHDTQDDDVSVEAAYRIHKHAKNAKLLITEGLGHRKILGDKKVIECMRNFIKEN